MPDPFVHHGIDHLSPSSIRLYRDNPAVWIGRYLLRAPDEAGPGAWRGRAIEAGLDLHLFNGADLGHALAAAQQAWDRQAMGVADDATMVEYNALAGYLNQAMLAFKDRGMPLTRQGKITLAIPGCTVPLIGYTDYRYPERGYDLKTTKRVPTVQPSSAHIEQIACYSLATGLPFSVVYCSTKRWTSYDPSLDELRDGWDRVCEGAHALAAFLAKVEDGRDALSMFAPDYTSFYFSPAMIEAVKAAKKPVIESVTVEVQQ